MKRFLSWDCANKTLAWAHFTCNTEVYPQILALISELEHEVAHVSNTDNTGEKSGTNDHTNMGNKNNNTDNTKCDDNMIAKKCVKYIGEIKSLMDNFIKFHSFGVKDILNGKLVSAVSEVERTRLLRDFLTTGPISAAAINAVDADGCKTKVLIEHQPNKIGLKTNNKSTLVEHQLCFYYIDFDPELINPRFKNDVKISAECTFAGCKEICEKRYKNSKDAIYRARKMHSRESVKILSDVFHLNLMKGIPKACQDDLADAVMQCLAYIFL